MSSYSNILKFAAVGGGITVALSYATPLVSSVIPEQLRGFLFQTYQNPAGAFVNEMIIIILTFWLVNNVDAIRNLTGLISSP